MAYSNVLFLSKDSAYTRAMGFILKRSFDVKKTDQASSLTDLQIKRQLLNPDIVLIDTDTCDKFDTEIFHSIKSTFPASIYAIIEDEEKQKTASNPSIGNFINKKKFSEGFSELIESYNIGIKHSDNILYEEQPKIKRKLSKSFTKLFYSAVRQ